jgi:AraC-like DNA-binding protein
MSQRCQKGTLEVGSAVSKGRVKSRQPISLIRSGCTHSAAPGRPVKLDRAIPIAALRHHVRCFEQREAHLARGAVVYPIAARPELFIEFYLNQRYLVRICETVAQELAPRTVVVGPSTFRRAELVLQGDFDVFTIHFQASGFHRLFRVPVADLSDRAYDAQSILGPVVSEVEERLADASTFQERIQVATDFLLRRLDDQNGPDAVSTIANRLLLERGALRVDRAAAKAGIGIRQFERRFIEQVGLSPKLYMGIVRFDAALKAKMVAPRRPWTDIAQACGYYDQMHMVRDFERFAGESPSVFVRRFQETPDPWA